jgi:undecaprenyl-diphosphatase
MLDLLALDEQLFHWINSGWSNGILDAIAPYWRHKLMWMPLYFFIVSFILVNFKKKGIIMILAIFLTGGIADITSSHIIKKNVERLRPCNDPDVKSEMILRTRCGRGYSFTSSHATNHFAIASIIVLLLGGIWTWIKWPLFLWAGTISLGQVYVGVHYPIDILCGAILGYFCGRLAYYLYKKIPISFLNQVGAA